MPRATLHVSHDAVRYVPRNTGLGWLGLSNLKCQVSASTCSSFFLGRLWVQPIPIKIMAGKPFVSWPVGIPDSFGGEPSDGSPPGKSFASPARADFGETTAR